MNDRKVRVAILNVGDPEEDADRLTEALAVLHAELARGPFQEVDYHVSVSEQALLRAKLRVWSESEHSAADVILTCGGVGLAVRDRMPEATFEVTDRRLPGVSELIRLACVRHDPAVAFLRLEAGIRGQTVIINLPGEAERLKRCLPALLPQLPAVVRQLRAPATAEAGD